MKFNIIDVWKRNITAKLIITVSSLIIVTLLINAFVVIYLKTTERETLIETKRKELSDDLEERTSQFATFATPEIISIYKEYYNYQLSGRDQASVFQEYFIDRMYEKLDTNLDISRGHMYIYSSEGNILFDSSELESGKYNGPARVVKDEDLLAKIKSEETVLADTTRLKGEKVLDVVYPVIEETGIGHLFTVRYLASFKEMEKRIATMEEQFDSMTRRSIVSVVILTVAGIIVAFIVALFIGRTISNPIIRLAEDATIIAGGNLDKEVKIRSEDEVGILAKQFEEMRVSLKQKIREIAKKALGLEGTLEVFSFPDLIGFICGSQMTGCLTMEGVEKGAIYFDMGNIVHAIIGDGRLVGEPAVYNFFTWSKGSFLFEAGVKHQDENTVRGHWQHLLMEGARQTDEMDVIKQLIPSTSAELAVLPQPSDAQKEIKLTPEEMNIIALIQQERTVKNILARSPQAEFETYKIMYSLVSSGLVEVRT